MANKEIERTLPNLNVRGKRKKKALELGIKPVKTEIDTRKAKEVPLYVQTPTKDGGELPEAVVEGKRPTVAQPTQAESDAKRKKFADDIYSKFAPYVMGPQTTEETIKKGHSVYDTEKEAQARRDQENVDNYTKAQAKRLYDEAFKEEGGEPKKAKIHDDVEIIDDTLEGEDMPAKGEDKDADTTPKKEDEKKESNPLDDYVKLVNDLWTKEDEETAKKKQKAAQWILAAQMLGDSIGALSNVYWTGKGANAQKLDPGAPKAAAATYQLEQDIRNAREKAAKAKLDATLKKYELEMQREREKRNEAENKRRYDNNVAYRRERDAIVDAREKELMEFRRQQENRIAKSSQGASTSTKDVEPIEFTLGDGETIGIDKFNKDKLNRLYRSLPEDVRYATENEEVYSDGVSMGTRKRKVTDDDRLQAIYDNLYNPEVANAIRRLAGVEVDPKEDKREKENTSKNNTEPPIQAYSAPADEWGSQWRRRAGLDTTDFSQFKRK